MSRSPRNSARRSRRWAALVLAGCLWASGVDAAPAARFGLGKPATPAEIAGWDIDVRGDGAGLPTGRGSVAQGQDLYDAKCAACHGTFGESNSYLQIAGGVGTLASDQPIRTTGSKLNAAPTLFDYIRRAMPFNAPQSLATDEVYALTAYVLNLNDILPSDAVVDQDSLPKVRMPNRDGFTTAHGFMRRDGKPDTANVACMRDCASEVRLSSEIPAYALDVHGDLAEQRRSIGAIGGVVTSTAAPKAVASALSLAANAATPNRSAAPEIARRMGCLGCHGVDVRVVGPAFREVARRYRGDGVRTEPPDAAARLVAKLRTGGAGTWGSVAMPAQAQVGDADARALIDWILAGAR